MQYRGTAVAVICVNTYLAILAVARAIMAKRQTTTATFILERAQRERGDSELCRQVSVCAVQTYHAYYLAVAQKFFNVT